MIVAFTGHRPSKLGGYKIPNPIYTYVRNKIKAQLIELKVDKIISGMALGVDQWAVDIAVELNIPFIAAIPFLGQESKWPISSQELYKKLLAKAEELVVVSPGEYEAWKMQTRNEWMVNNCDVLIAVWDGSAGGTCNCINYANSKNKKIILIYPNDI